MTKLTRTQERDVALEAMLYQAETREPAFIREVTEAQTGFRAPDEESVCRIVQRMRELAAAMEEWDADDRKRNPV